MSPRWRSPLTVLPRVDWAEQQPTWRAARPAVIDAALRRAQARPSGNWYVLAPSDAVRRGQALGRTVAGVELVAWRDRAGRVRCGPGACPHLGAPLCHSPVVGDRLVCHWHGLALDGTPTAGWRPRPVYDDGVLVWVRLDEVGGEEPLPRPVLPERPPPATAVTAVTTAVGVCEPEDVLANRLDPWHGAWFHPYAFTRLRVLAEPSDAPGRDRFLVEVAYRFTGRTGVPVRAVFTAPEPRTVVMRIVEGEGTSSVVETHACPLAPGPDGRPRTAVVEAVLATSDRPAFPLVRRAAPLLRPLLRRASARLWRDDLAYAERRWRLRQEGRHPGG